jgi:hypothetical protein
MTNVFNDQVQNTVFAAPDGADGQPTFRTLTANDIPATGLPVVVMTSDSANIQYTDTYFSPQFKISANTLEVGSTFRITLAADVMYAYQPALNLRFGTTGTASDPAIYPFMSAGGLNELLVTFRSIGTNANVQIVPLTAGIAPSTSNVANLKAFSSVSAQVDTTIDNYMGFTYHMGYPGVGTNIFNTCVIQQIK